MRKHNFIQFLLIVVFAFLAFAAPASAQTQPGYGASASVSVNPDGTIKIIANRSELYIQGDEVANETYHGTSVGNDQWEYTVKATSLSVEVKFASELTFPDGSCRISAGTTWFICNKATNNNTGSNNTGAKTNGTKPSGMPEGYQQPTVIIDAASTSDQVVLKISGPSEIYVQGNTLADPDTKLFNETIQVVNGIAKFERRGAEAMEVKYCSSLTSDAVANYLTEPQHPCWFEFHSVGQLQPTPTPDDHGIAAAKACTDQGGIYMDSKCYPKTDCPSCCQATLCPTGNYTQTIVVSGEVDVNVHVDGGDQKDDNVSFTSNATRTGVLSTVLGNTQSANDGMATVTYHTPSLVAGGVLGIGAILPWLIIIPLGLGVIILLLRRART